MTDLIDDKLKDICKLLVERRFTIVCDVSDDLICGICKDILVNASQTVYGCLFCEKCIDKYVEYNAVGCPGKTEECKSSSLSNIMVDHRRNRKISRLIVRCNKEDCHFECKLMEMKSHLEDCSTETIECPFMIVGCEKERLSSDKMNEHLQRESLNHNKLLLDMVNNLRNEIRELRENVEKRKFEIENLNEKLWFNETELQIVRENDEEIKCTIENLRAKITLNETELQILKEKDETNRTVIERRENEFDSLQKIIEKNKDELKILRELREEIELKNVVTRDVLSNREIKNEKLRKDFEDIKNKIQNLNSITNMIKVKGKESEDDIEEMKETIKSHLTKIESLEQGKLETDKKVYSLINIPSIKINEFNNLCTKVNQLEDYLDVEDGVFLWHIGMIDELNNFTYSSRFSDINNSYKLKLKLENECNSLIVRLLIFRTNDNDNADWPFTANVTISIIHKFCTSKTLSISKNCNIIKPVSKKYHQSFPFKFSKSNLSNIGIPSNESVCTIECDVDLQ